MLEYTTTIVTAPEATTATAARWEHCIGLTVQAHTELTLRLPKSKAGALAVLARLTAAVEALPDDTHAGQGVLPTETLTRFCKYGDTIQKPCTHAECRPEYVPDLLGALDRSIQQARADRAAPVWRTLTFGDLRAGDVIKSDENGLEGTVIELGGIIAGSDGKERWVRSSIGGSYPRSGDPVLVRHPRPEVGQ